MAIVFVHGAGSHAGFWQAQRAAFPQSHYLNLPDHSERTKNEEPALSLPKGRRACPELAEGTKNTLNRAFTVGVGAKDRTPSIENYADWVAGYVEDKGLQNVVLNGHSMGGAIVMELALRQPPWLEALILTCTGARLPVNPRLLDTLRSDYPGAVDLIVKWNFAQQPGNPSYGQKARMEGTRRQMLRTPQSVTLDDYEACNRFDVEARLLEIGVPTLCVVGAQDKMTPPQLSRELHEGIKGSRLVMIEEAGHMLPVERPEEYNEVVVNFTASL